MLCLNLSTHETTLTTVYLPYFADSIFKCHSIPILNLNPNSSLVPHLEPWPTAAPKCKSASKDLDHGVAVVGAQ